MNCQWGHETYHAAAAYFVLFVLGPAVPSSTLPVRRRRDSPCPGLSRSRPDTISRLSGCAAGSIPQGQSRVHCSHRDCFGQSNVASVTHLLHVTCPLISLRGPRDAWPNSTIADDRSEIPKVHTHDPWIPPPTKEPRLPPCKLCPTDTQRGLQQQLDSETLNDMGDGISLPASYKYLPRLGNLTCHLLHGQTAQREGRQLQHNKQDSK